MEKDRHKEEINKVQANIEKITEKEKKERDKFEQGVLNLLKDTEERIHTKLDVFTNGTTNKFGTSTNKLTKLDEDLRELAQQTMKALLAVKLEIQE